jgi:hypothetical protein
MNKREAQVPLTISGLAVHTYDGASGRDEFICGAFLVCPLFALLHPPSPGKVRNPNDATFKAASIQRCAAKTQDFSPEIVRSADGKTATCTLQPVASA